MHLSPEEIAAAETCGVSFLPASDAQVQRLAMQRKVFYRAGAAILATRGDGFFETAGTLRHLIEEGRRQQHDLSQWLEAAPKPAAALPEAGPEPKAAEAGTAMPEQSTSEPVAAEPAAPPPKRPRQKRRRPEPPVLEQATVDLASEAPVAEVAAEPPQDMDAEAEMTEAAAAPLPAAPLRLAPARSPGRTAARAPTAPAENPGQDRGKRWLMAGAARRGRAGKHWSTRQR